MSDDCSRRCSITSRHIAKLPVASVPLIVSVPSGNFGNLTAGLFAKRIGLQLLNLLPPRTRMTWCPSIAQREFNPRPAQATYSNAMDVGNPNNFSALAGFVRGRLEYVRKEIWGHGATDAETLAEMKIHLGTVSLHRRPSHGP